MIANGFNGYTTKYLSEVSGIDRSNSSRELNELFEEGLMTKVKAKPVKSFSVSVLEKLFGIDVVTYELDSLSSLITESKSLVSTFDTIIGNMGSLKNAISKSKAEMLYPTFGLHSMHVGPAGVGY